MLDPKNIIKAVFLPKQLPLLMLTNFLKEYVIMAEAGDTWHKIKLREICPFSETFS